MDLWGIIVDEKNGSVYLQQVDHVNKSYVLT